MSIFVDTSALLAVIYDEADRHHDAERVWHDLLSPDEPLWTTNYVLVETYALLQRRHGLAYVNALRDAAVSALLVQWVTSEQHDAGLSAVLAANRRDLSLVDCVSFVVMRELGLTTAFTLDPHFAEQGFDIIPAAANQSLS